MKQYFQHQLDTSTPLTEKDIQRMISVRKEHLSEEQLDEYSKKIKSKIGKKQVYCIFKPNEKMKQEGICSEIQRIFEDEIDELAAIATFVEINNSSLPILQFKESIHK